MTYNIRKGRNMAWIHDNNRTILVSDALFVPLPSSSVVEVEPQPNIDAIQDLVTPKTDSLSPVLTEEHTAVTNDRPKRLRTQTQKYRAGFT